MKSELALMIGAILVLGALIPGLTLTSQLAFADDEGGGHSDAGDDGKKHGDDGNKKHDKHDKDGKHDKHDKDNDDDNECNYDKDGKYDRDGNYDKDGNWCGSDDYDVNYNGQGAAAIVTTSGISSSAAAAIGGTVVQDATIGDSAISAATDGIGITPTGITPAEGGLAAALS